MTTFTSSLPDNLLHRLSDAAQSYGLAKNKIIEKALEIYLDQLKRAEYVKSYKAAGEDVEIMQVAEEGMQEYLSNIDKEDN